MQRAHRGFFCLLREFSRGTGGAKMVLVLKRPEVTKGDLGRKLGIIPDKRRKSHACGYGCVGSQNPWRKQAELEVNAQAWRGHGTHVQVAMM